MASSLHRIGTHGRTLTGPLFRSFASSADALVDYKPGEIGLVSGIPDEHLSRRVVIYSPARTASQQGSGKVGRWKINFVSTQKWENPLMGWTSTGDPYANVGDSALTFDSEEAAKSFAERHGWEYVYIENLIEDFRFRGHVNPGYDVIDISSIRKESWKVRKRHTPLLKVKAYADNFKFKGFPKTEEA